MTTIPATVQQPVPMPMPAPAAPAASGGPSITPADIVAMIKQRIVTIIILWILFAGAGVGLFFLAWFEYPLYSAMALVECISDRPAEPMQFGGTDLNEDPFLRFVESQSLYIESYPVLSEVLKDSEVRQNTKWFKSIETGDHLLELEDDLRVGHVRDTNYIKVSIATRSPQDPHRIVNTVVNTYLNEVRDRYTQPFRQELQEYKREYQKIQNEITGESGIQERIREFLAQLPPGVGTNRDNLGKGVTIEQLIEDQRLVSMLQQETDSLKSLLELYTNPSEQAVTPEDRLQVESDPRVASLNSQVIALEQELQIHLQSFGPNHREYIEMKTRLDEVQRQLGQSRRVKLREVLEFKTEQLRTAYYNSQNSLLLAQERLQESEAKQADLERKLAEYATFLDELDRLIERRNEVRDYIAEIERIVLQQGGIRVESAVPASVPLKRSFPPLVLLPGVVLLALGGAVGIALLLELVDTSVRTAQDVVRHLHVPMLGAIPDERDEEVDIEQVETAVHDAPHSMITEAFRTVRSNLQFSAPADRLRTLLITSPKPEDGRTTVASNLAASLASGGRRVLLVDTNFRKPALHRFYKNIGPRGMSHILIGEAQLSDCVAHTDLPNLDVIGSGPVPPNPAELLGGDLCRAFVAEVSALYDHVIFDSPPVLLASDAPVLATLVHGTVLVFRAMENSRGVAQRSISLLTHVNAHVVGAVLNGAQARRGGYFREHVRTFYEYQLEEEGEEKPRGKRKALPEGESPEAENPKTKRGKRKGRGGAAAATTGGVVAGDAATPDAAANDRSPGGPDGADDLDDGVDGLRFEHDLRSEIQRDDEAGDPGRDAEDGPPDGDRDDDEPWPRLDP